MSDHESNNPPLPPPDMDALEATMIRAKNPLPAISNEPQCTCTGDSPMHDDDCPLRKSWKHAPAGGMELAPPIKNRARPRRGPQREPIFHRDDYRAAIIIIALSFPVGFLGAVLGILLMSHI